MNWGRRKSFRERMGAENKRFRDMCDTEYWCCICFTSRAQKEEFLASLEFDTDLKVHRRQGIRAGGKASD